ncbi:MAG: hypothetical protein ACLFUT_11100, partial [Desulfobacteraceae bacterium]
MHGSTLMKYNVALLHYSCPPVVGGVEEIMRQHASLLTRHYHNVKVFAGDGGAFSDTIDIEINPLLGSHNQEILEVHQRSLKDHSHTLDPIVRKIYDYLTSALKGFDVLIAHNVLTMPYNLPLCAALHQIAREGLLPIISWNH